MKVVVGLGNPGRRYERTRHNVGVLVVERLAERWGFSASQRSQLGASVGDGNIRHERALLAMPQSFMNRSGHPVASLAGYYKLPPEEVTVVHDDLELAFGEVRCKSGGGHGGHNGLRDVHKHLGSGFSRVRVGVGRPPDGWDVADYVLGKWSPEEAASLDGVLDTAADAVETILTDGIVSAISQFDSRATTRSGSPSTPARAPRERVQEEQT